MRSSKLFLIASALCVSALLASTAQAELISAATISASASSNPSSGGTSPIYAVNGSGLSGTNHASVQSGTMWLGYDYAGNNLSGQFLTIDLEKNYNLDSTNTLKVWNYNHSTVLNRGIRMASFWYLSDDGGAVLTDTTQPAGALTQLTGVTTDAAGGVTFDMANGSDTATNFNTVSFNTPITARYIRIQVAGEVGVGNYGGGEDVAHGYVGLSEVQVFGTVPEPNTLMLLATGLIGLLCYAWRKRR